MLFEKGWLHNPTVLGQELFVGGHDAGCEAMVERYLGREVLVPWTMVAISQSPQRSKQMFGNVSTGTFEGFGLSVT